MIAGYCSVCDRVIPIRRDGSIRIHILLGTRMGCPGSNKPPVTKPFGGHDRNDPPACPKHQTPLERKTLNYQSGRIGGWWCRQCESFHYSLKERP